MNKTILTTLLSLAVATVTAGESISLAGRWRILADPAGTEGFAKGWYRDALPIHATAYPAGLGMQTVDFISLPGGPEKAGLGVVTRPLSQITPDQENPIEFRGSYWLQRYITVPDGFEGAALFSTNPLPSGSKLYWNGKQAAVDANGFMVEVAPGKNLATVYIGEEDAENQLPSGGFTLTAGGRILSLDGNWRIVPEMHNNAFAALWSTGELPTPKKLYLYNASYFRGAQYSTADSISLPATPASAGIAMMLNPSRAITPGLEKAIRYEGPFWVQRKVVVPATWDGRNGTFMIERTVGVSKCYWDGRSVGECHGYDVPQRFAIPAAMMTPGEHTLTIFNSRSDHAFPQTGHGVRSENGASWSGLLGRIELSLDSEMENIQIYTDVSVNALTVKMESPIGKQVRFSWRPKGKGNFTLLKTVPSGARQYRINLPEKAVLWDEFNPNLYELRCELTGGVTQDVREVVFGMRSFTATPAGFMLNGRHVMLRGAQQCGAEPLWNATPMGRQYWDKIMAVTKQWGMNHLRFHSWCPPEEAFAAADEAGIIFQIEVPHDDIKAPDRKSYKELMRIVDEYGNHPSFCMITLGNERFNHDETSRGAIAAAAMHDPRHLYSCTSHPVDNSCTDEFYISAWGINDPQSNGWGNPIVGIEWGGGDVVTKSRFNTRAPETCYDYRLEIEGNRAPIITHEVGQWTMFPRLDVMGKYEGMLVNTNYQRIEEKLISRGMLSLADRFANASGRFSAIFYKEEIESNLRTPGLAGYSLLGINDFPGQHLSVVGMLDEFWDDKRVVSPEFHAQFSRAVVPLARMCKRTWTEGEIFEAAVEISNYGSATITAPVAWEVTGNGHVVASGTFPAKNLSQGSLTAVGTVKMPIPAKGARKLVLSVEIPGSQVFNCWDFWVYPAAVDLSPRGVKVARAWDENVRKALAEGQNVLLIPDRETLSQGYRDACFVPVFWNSIFKWMQRAHTMGVLCDPSHSVFESFPTEFHADWQWWDIMTNANAMYLNDLPQELSPLVQVIDSYVFCDKLAYLWECRADKGRLMVCTIDLGGDLAARPASRQLYASLLDYMNSPAFTPRTAIEIIELNQLFE